MEKQSKSPFDAIEHWPVADQKEFLDCLVTAIIRAVDDKYGQEGVVPLLVHAYEHALRHMRADAVLTLFQGIGLELRFHKNQEKFEVKHDDTEYFVIADTCSEIARRLELLQKKGNLMH